MHDFLSVAFLSCLPLIAIVPVWTAFRLPSEYSNWERILYAPVYCVARILWRVEVVGGVRLVEAYPGGAVVVANHRCSLDPFFLQLAAGRRVHWMVAGEYFRNPVFGPILRTFQAIPTNRSGADNASMKTAIRLASEGRFVGMFPEGRINRTPKALLSIRPGAGLVSSKAQVPLLPCWIEGAPSGWDVWSGLFMASHVKISIGNAMDLTSNPDSSPEELVERAMQSSLALGGHSLCPVEMAGNKSHRATKVRKEHLGSS